MYYLPVLLWQDPVQVHSNCLALNIIYALLHQFLFQNTNLTLAALEWLNDTCIPSPPIWLFRYLRLFALSSKLELLSVSLVGSSYRELTFKSLDQPWNPNEKFSVNWIGYELRPHFCRWRIPIRWYFLSRIYLIFLSCSLSFHFLFFYIKFFVTHFIIFPSHGTVADYLSRKGGNLACEYSRFS